MSTLAAETLSAGYGARPILTDLDLTVPPGAITAIVGANACGKSTLLRCLARLLKPSAGRVVLDGRAVRDIPTRAYDTPCRGTLPGTGAGRYALALARTEPGEDPERPASRCSSRRTES